MRIEVRDIHNTVGEITTWARALELIPVSANVEYHKGNATYGISPTLSVWELLRDGTRQTHREDFLPVFTYKSTRLSQYRELEATRKALVAMVRLIEQ